MNPLLLLTLGSLTGALGAAILFPVAAPIPGEWGAILGSFIGVAGALAAAWTGIKWNENSHERTRAKGIIIKISSIAHYLETVEDEAQSISRRLQHATDLFYAEYTNATRLGISSHIFAEEKPSVSFNTMDMMKLNEAVERLRSIRHSLVHEEREGLRESLKTIKYDIKLFTQIKNEDLPTAYIQALRTTNKELKSALNALGEIKLASTKVNMIEARGHFVKVTDIYPKIDDARFSLINSIKDAKSQIRTIQEYCESN